MIADTPRLLDSSSSSFTGSQLRRLTSTRSNNDSLALRHSSPTFFRQRLASIYAAHSPHKVHQIDVILKRYEGFEDVLLRKVVKKYAPDPALFRDLFVDS